MNFIDFDLFGQVCVQQFFVTSYFQGDFIFYGKWKVEDLIFYSFSFFLGEMFF